MTQFIKVSKQGIDALGTAGTVPNNLIFDSTLNTFKILATGTASGTIPTTDGTITVAHGQSFTPAVFAFCKFSDGTVALPDSSKASEDLVRWEVEVDGTNMYFKLYNNTGTADGTAVVRYYVFEAPL